MKKISAVLLFVLLSFLSLSWFSSAPVFAQGNAASATTTKEVTTLRGEVATLRAEVKAAKVREATPSPEVLALRAQLETMKEYDEKIIAVVYWSLGAVFIIGAFLVGSNWYTSKRNYEREKAEFEKDTNETKMRFDKDADETRIRLQRETDEAKTRLITEITESYERDKTFFQQISQKSLEDSVTGIKNDIKSNVEDVVKDYIFNINKDVIRIEIDLLDLERQSWKAQGLYTNAIRTDIQMLEILTGSKSGGVDSFRVKKVLDALNNDMEAVVSSGFGINASTARDAEQLLSILTTSYKNETEAISSLITEARDIRTKSERVKASKTTPESP